MKVLDLSKFIFFSFRHVCTTAGKSRLKPVTDFFQGPTLANLMRHNISNLIGQSGSFKKRGKILIFVTHLQDNMR